MNFWKIHFSTYSRKLSHTMTLLHTSDQPSGKPPRRSSRIDNIGATHVPRGEVYYRFHTSTPHAHLPYTAVLPWFKRQLDDVHKNRHDNPLVRLGRLGPGGQRYRGRSRRRWLLFPLLVQRGHGRAGPGGRLFAPQIATSFRVTLHTIQLLAGRRRKFAPLGKKEELGVKS